MLALRWSDTMFICVMACIAAMTPCINATFGSGTLPATGAAGGGAPACAGGGICGGATGMDGSIGGCTITGSVIGAPLPSRPYGISIALVSLTFFTHANNPVIANG